MQQGAQGVSRAELAFTTPSGAMLFLCLPMNLLHATTSKRKLAMSVWLDASAVSCVFLSAVAGIAMIDVNSYTNYADKFYSFLDRSDETNLTICTLAP